MERDDRDVALPGELQLARGVAADHEFRSRTGGDDAEQPRAFLAELHRRLAFGPLPANGQAVNTGCEEV